MLRRVLAAIMTVTTIVVLLFAVPLGFVIGRLLNDRAVLALEHRADLAARSIDLTSPTDAPDATEFPSGPEHFALYTADGSLRTGTGPKRLDTLTAKGRTGNTVTQHIDGELVSTVPIVSGEKTLGFIRAARSLRQIRRATQRALVLLGAGAIAALVIGWILGRRLANGISTATAALRDAAVRLGSGDFTVHVPPAGIAELDDISTALWATARELGELVNREQAFTADASHQLRTPIAGMRASLEAELAFPRADRQSVIRESLTDLARLEQTVTDLLALARSNGVSDNVIDPLIIASEARDHWAGKFAQKGRPLTLRSATTSTVAYGRTALLRQGIDALLDNALSHGTGPTTIELRQETHSGASSMTIAISDEGPGFPDGAEQGAASGERSGRGLPLTRRLAQAQGGRLVFSGRGPHPTVQIVLRAPAKTDHSDCSDCSDCEEDLEARARARVNES